MSASQSETKVRCEFIRQKFKRLPVRAWIVALIFLTAFMNSALASNISFIMDAMTVQPTQVQTPVCRRTKGPLWETVEVPDLGPRHNWSKSVQWHIEVAYFYGVAIASPPAGILAEWLGPKKTICFPLLFAGIFNVLSANAAKWGWGVVFACRFIVGLSSGTVNPALQCLIGKWAPPNEKGKFVNALQGDNIGTAMLWVMIQYTAPQLGWPWTYYILSIVISIYCVAFWFLAASEPEDHPYISEEEIEFIRTAQGSKRVDQKELPPFKQIVSSSYCWALTILNFGSMWGINMQTQIVPKFIQQYMGITANESVFLAILPLIAKFLSGIVFGNLSDFIRTRHMLNRTLMSKVFVIFSHLLPAIITMSFGSVKCNAVGASVVMVMSYLFSAAAVGANLRGPTDLSPNFAGTIYGINMCLGVTTGFIVPAIGNWILGYQNDIIGWTIIFLIGGGAYLGTGIIYLWFGSAQTQPWNTKSGHRPLRRSTARPSYA